MRHNTIGKFLSMILLNFQRTRQGWQKPGLHKKNSTRSDQFDWKNK